MKTNFFHIRTALYLLFGFIALSSCSKDDEHDDLNINVENKLEYDGRTHTLNVGTLEDLGYDGSHYNMEFSIFHLVSEYDPIIPAFLFVDLFSPHENSFRGGTFHFTEDYDRIDGAYYFDYGYLILNFDLLNNTAEKMVEVKGGWVKVAGQGTDYQLE